MFTGVYWEGVSIPWWQLLLTALGVIAAIALIIAIITIVQRKRGAHFYHSTRDITYGAVCIAASFALSYIKFFSLPYGGSITAASVLPMLIYCYYFGFRKSLIVSSVYMLLQFIQGPYVVSPWSAVLDYVVPYMALSLVGLLKFDRKKLDKVTSADKNPVLCHSGFFIGTSLYFIVRLFSHTLAGVLFWAQGIDFLAWHGDLVGTAAWGYSATYNFLFLGPDTAIAIIAAVLLLSSKAFNAFMASSCHALKNPDAAHKDDQRA